MPVFVSVLRFTSSRDDSDRRRALDDDVADKRIAAFARASPRSGEEAAEPIES
jgi:hypothetical protein